MNRFIKSAIMGSLFIAGLSLANNAPQSYTIDQLPQLTQEAQHKTVSERVTSRFTRAHYHKFILNDEFSNKIFERYINQLDYGRNVLLASDIASFDTKRVQLGSELKNGQLDTAYELYNLAQKRRFERLQYALSLLDQPMNFTDDDVINLDRQKSPWPTDTEELDQLWYEKVKYDQLSLTLAGKSPEQIKETLQKRYQLAIKRLTQANSEDVFQTLMNAFAREIDPHTSYLSPRGTKQFNTEMSLSLEGIGAVLSVDDDYAVISSLIVGGPAAKSEQLVAGDRIVGVGQAGKPMEDVIGWRLDDIVDKIKGPKGTQVYLDILPAGVNSQIKRVTLTRDRVRLEDSAVKMSIENVGERNVAVLTVPSFYVGLTENVQTYLAQLQKEKIDSLVIDLRNNGGGALTEAISLSGLFIDKGPVVQIQDNQRKIQQYDDTDGLIYYSGPLVVLVNRYSASASEIFAAAMQDYGRALIVGEPTFGKGTVQTHRPLSHLYDKMIHPNWPDLGAVQYTIQKFYRINGGSTQLKGVTPDILMPTSIFSSESGESLEDNALPWDSIAAASYQRIADATGHLANLMQLHQARIEQNIEFKFINEDVALYAKNKDKRYLVSLNLAQREKENKEYDQRRLDRANQRLVNEGAKIIEKLEQLPTDYKAPDAYLDETVRIALDFADQNMPRLESK